jgi:hypothetical protein
VLIKVIRYNKSMSELCYCFVVLHFTISIVLSIEIVINFHEVAVYYDAWICIVHSDIFHNLCRDRLMPSGCIHLENVQGQIK